MWRHLSCFQYSRKTLGEFIEDLDHFKKTFQKSIGCLNQAQCYERVLTFFFLFFSFLPGLLLSTLELFKGKRYSPRYCFQCVFFLVISVPVKQFHNYPFRNYKAYAFFFIKRKSYKHIHIFYRCVDIMQMLIERPTSECQIPAVFRIGRTLTFFS